MIDRLPVNKGAMTLIDSKTAAEMYAALGPGVECSGVSAANTVVGAAMLGVRTAFIGRVKNDQMGGIFTHDIRSAGVKFDTLAATDGTATAGCMRGNAQGNRDRQGRLPRIGTVPERPLLR